MAIDGRFTSRFIIKTGKTYVLSCKAIGSKPAVGLLWQIDNLPLHSTNTTLYVMKNRTFVTVSLLEYSTSIIPRNISCSSVGQNSIESVSVYIDIMPYGKYV